MESCRENGLSMYDSANSETINQKQPMSIENNKPVLLFQELSVVNK